MSQHYEFLQERLPARILVLHNFLNDRLLMDFKVDIKFINNDGYCFHTVSPMKQSSLEDEEDLGLFRSKDVKVFKNICENAITMEISMVRTDSDIDHLYETASIEKSRDITLQKLCHIYDYDSFLKSLIKDMIRGINENYYFNCNA